jgi:hypothetical protein
LRKELLDEGGGRLSRHVAATGIGMELGILSPAAGELPRSGW